jgi:hypothetical protein
MRIIPRTRGGKATAVAAGAAAALVISLNLASAAPQAPMQQYGDAHPAVPCSRIASQVQALSQLLSIFPGPVLPDPYAAEQKLAAEFGDVSSGSGSALAVAEVNFENDVDWLPAGSTGYSSQVAGDVSGLAALC